MSKTALIGIASVAAVADAFAPGGGFIAPSLALRGSGASRLGHASAACRFGGGRGGSTSGLHGLRAQENKGGEDKGIVDKIADKGIWQFGVSKDVGDALSKVGWADNSEEGAAEGEGAEGEGELEEGMRVKELPRFEREDIEGLVAKAVAAEIFADDRSKEMFTADAREALVKELVRREVKEDLGVELEDLLNPIKVVSLETKILAAEAELGKGGIDAARREQLETELVSNRDKLATEKKAVMRDWLKAIFRGQALISILVGGYMANTPDVPVYARALGFWTIWLFTIPSLRAVKPLGYPSVGMSAAVEKKALNLAFVLTPLLTLALPFATKDTAAIFWADFFAVVLCYAGYYLKGDDPNDEGGVEIKGVLRYLDYGTGRERGARK